MPGMWYDINHIMSMIDLTWCDIYNTDRYVIRSQAETTEDAESTTEHVRIEQYAIFRFIFSRRKNCIKWTICHVCDTKPTTWCFSSISHDMYTTNCQVCDKKSTTWCYSRGNRTPESEKSRRRYISWMKVVGMIDRVWYALTIISGTAWYVIRNAAGLLVSCYGKAHPCQDGTEAYGERNPALP